MEADGREGSQVWGPRAGESRNAPTKNGRENPRISLGNHGCAEPAHDPLIDLAEHIRVGIQVMRSHFDTGGVQESFDALRLPSCLGIGRRRVKDVFPLQMSETSERKTKHDKRAVWN